MAGVKEKSSSLREREKKKNETLESLLPGTFSRRNSRSRNFDRHDAEQRSSNFHRNRVSSDVYILFKQFVYYGKFQAIFLSIE